MLYFHLNPTRTDSDYRNSEADFRSKIEWGKSYVLSRTKIRAKIFEI